MQIQSGHLQYYYAGQFPIILNRHISIEASLKNDRNEQNNNQQSRKHNSVQSVLVAKFRRQSSIYVTGLDIESSFLVPQGTLTTWFVVTFENK